MARLLKEVWKATGLDKVFATYEEAAMAERRKAVFDVMQQQWSSPNNGYGERSYLSGRYCDAVIDELIAQGLLAPIPPKPEDV